MNTLKTTLLVALLSTAAFHADAGTPAHPSQPEAAAPVEIQAQAASPKLIGHPASPRWVVTHANAPHPAVLVAARAATIDPNTFLVQPPSATQWTMGPADDSVPVTTAVAAR